MRGSYWFKAKSKKVLFEFSIRRNITVIKGDSATGKTTLLHILYEYLRSGRQSGYSVSTNAQYYVYIRDEVGRDWKDSLYPLKNTVIFIEENNDFVFSEEFASFVRESGNYFVLVTRSPLKMLPYSIHEIYEIITDGKRTDIKESYHEFKEIYSNYPILENNKIQKGCDDHDPYDQTALHCVYRKQNHIQNCKPLHLDRDNAVKQKLIIRHDGCTGKENGHIDIVSTVKASKSGNASDQSIHNKSSDNRK